MTTHRFRLQTVLDWRRDQDEAAQRALGVARQALHDAEMQLAAMHARLEDARVKTRVAEEGGCDSAARAWHWNWITGRQDDVRRAERGVEECRTAVTQASLAAQAARRGLRTLERLRDRALERHEYQQKRLDQQALDALAATGF